MKIFGHPPATILLFLSLSMLLPGCGATNHFASFSPQFNPTRASRFTVASVVDAADPIKRTDMPADFKPTDELKSKIEQKLANSHITTAPAAADVIVLTPTITDYDPGNAALRGFAPGAGATILIVSCKVEQNGVDMGTIKTRRTVEWGSVVTVGQWKAIFDPVAADIVDAVNDKINQHK